MHDHVDVPASIDNRFMAPAKVAFRQARVSQHRVMIERVEKIAVGFSHSR